MILSDSQAASALYLGPGSQNNCQIPSKESIALISKEYALNTMLQAEIMRNNRPDRTAYQNTLHKYGHGNGRANFHQ